MGLEHSRLTEWILPSSPVFQERAHIYMPFRDPKPSLKQVPADPKPSLGPSDRR